ncbi:hypothetical protein ACLOJK_018652 [Asimina triloba]
MGSDDVAGSSFAAAWENDRMDGSPMGCCDGVVVRAIAIGDLEGDAAVLGIYSTVVIAGSKGDIVNRMLPNGFSIIRHGGLSTPAIADGEDEDLATAVTAVAGWRWWRRVAVSTDLASRPRCRPFGRLRSAIGGVLSGGFSVAMSKMMAHCLDGDDVVRDACQWGNQAPLVVAIIFPRIDRSIDGLPKSRRTVAMPGFP